MTLFYKFLILGVFTGLMNACAYPDRKQDFKPHSQADSRALIYLYRMDRGQLSADPDVPRFFVNGDWIGKLKLGGYYAFEVQPGPVTIFSRHSLFLIPFPWKDEVLRINVEPGQQYYVRHTKLAFEGEWLELVQPHLALQEIQKTKELEKCSSIFSCP